MMDSKADSTVPNYPWEEAATLSRHTPLSAAGPAQHDLLVESVLGRVIDIVARMPRMDRTHLLIAMPERRVPPYRYEPIQFDRLIEARSQEIQAGKRD